MRSLKRLPIQWKVGCKTMVDPIYFDARYIRIGHHDGISRFSVGLCTALVKRTEVIAIISDIRQLEKLPAGIKHVKLNDPTNPISELFIARKLNEIGARLVFSPMQTMGSFGRRYKLVLTLHDLIYYAHPTPPPTFSWPIRLGWRLFHLTFLPQRIMLNGADAIATVSQTTKALIEKNKLTRKPVFVVYNSGSGISQNKHRKQSKSLVYMGSFMDYKNVECLVDAMQALPDYQLHLLSKISNNRKVELNSRNETLKDRIIFHNGVTDLEYHELLSQAFALVSASKDEGFGIPVIEAMEQGTPAIISDIEIFREIGGQAASYFNPTKPAELVARIRELEVEAEWQTKSALSTQQSAKFNWDASAEALIKGISSL